MLPRTAYYFFHISIDAHACHALLYAAAAILLIFDYLYYARFAPLIRVALAPSLISLPPALASALLPRQAQHIGATPRHCPPCRLKRAAMLHTRRRVITLPDAATAVRHARCR